MQQYYKEKENDTQIPSDKHLEELLSSYWNENLYNRSYVNTSVNNKMKTPSEEELKNIYKQMHKYSDDDIKNCSSCGYNKCEKMAFLYQGQSLKIRRINHRKHLEGI